MNPFLARLLEKPTALESEKIREHEVILERLCQETSELSSEKWLAGMGRMAPFRLKASGNLSRGTVESWQKANAYVAQKIQEGHAPIWEDILQINSLLLGSETREFRKVPIYIGPHQACPVEWLEESVRHFNDEILKIENHSSPLIAAALSQYSLVSIHPFVDGNGRTAALLGDWILNLHGYLPMSFETRLDSLMGRFSDQRALATPGNAISKLIKNVCFSYELVLDKA
ncbi:Fic family protein [Bdellovibrio sp. HCB337]|uniref:Fic family protein n=1 Tax=Bdellovibrio sp. HCB337 TaxID=3394358 RepID=UPI0039A44578